MNQAPISPSVDGDEEDPFAGIDDLKDDTFASRPSGGGPAAADDVGMNMDPGSLLPVHEEFDLGPEFIRRQRDEEATWRSKVGQWFPEGTEMDWVKEREAEGQTWKWAIRDIAQQADQIG